MGGEQGVRDGERIVVQAVPYGVENMQEYEKLLRTLQRHGCMIEPAWKYQVVKFPEGTVQEKLLIPGHFLLNLPGGIKVAQMRCGDYWFLFIEK